MADYLSRVGATAGLVASVQSETRELEPDLLSTGFIPDRMRAEQQLDPEIFPVRAALLSDEKIQASTQTRPAFCGMLCFTFNGGRKLLPVIPRSLRAEALHLIHDAPLSSHMGRDRTWRRARNIF